MAETSDRVSAIAADLQNLTASDVALAVANPDADVLHNLVKRVRSVAASARRQDETKGLRGLAHKVFGAPPRIGLSDKQLAAWARAETHLDKLAGAIERLEGRPGVGKLTELKVLARRARAAIND